MKKIIIITMMTCAVLNATAQHGIKNNITVQAAADNANKSLSNLASATAINSSLLPGTDSAISLGNSSMNWRNLFMKGGIYINQALTLHATGMKNIFERAGDTSTIQNAVLKALSENKTRQSYDLMKSLLLQDPPVFNNNSDYSFIFQNMEDSLALSKLLFPDLLQLASVDDYKENIRSLLAMLVDSGYVKGSDYNSYFSKLFFDAKIQLKKQQGRDEKDLQKKDDDNDGYSNDNISKADNDEYNELEDFAVLLMPFYEKDKSVPIFMNKLLKSSDASLRLSTAVLLLRNDKKVADSVIEFLAAKDQYRSLLLRRLQAVGREDKFPAKYKNQLAIAKSQLVYTHASGEFASIEYIDKKLVSFKQEKGYVYFFRYKIHNDDDWQMGISGLQPEDIVQTSDNDDLVQLTNKKLKLDQNTQEQFNTQLKKILFSKHKSAVSFYFDNDYYVERDDDE